MPKKLWWAAIAATSILTLSATLLAHMKLARSVPAQGATLNARPASVQIWFTEAPDPKLTKITVQGSAGPIKLGAVRVESDKSAAAAVEGDMPDGAYTVNWQSAGNDGHVQKGSFTFTLRPAK
jgi:methionine-rich copper-binding protein CopC